MRTPAAASHADLFITDRCAFDCAHCFLGSELNARQEMSVEMVAAIAAYLADVGHSGATLLGGEPFQHPEVVEIVRVVRDAGLACRIVSNGHRHAERVLSSGLLPADVEIAFSVDGPTAEVHDAIRRPGSFARLLETVGVARAGGHPISAIVSISRQNRDYVQQTLGLCDELEIDRVTVHHVTARGHAQPDVVLDQRSWGEVLAAVGRFAQDRRTSVRCEDPFYSAEPSDHFTCAVRVGSNLMFFPDGRVYGCLLFIDTPRGNGAFWTGTNVALHQPEQGDVALCAGSCDDSCPATSLAPALYPGNGDRPIRCIYDKVTFGGAGAVTT